MHLAPRKSRKVALACFLAGFALTLTGAIPAAHAATTNSGFDTTSSSIPLDFAVGGQQVGAWDASQLAVTGAVQVGTNTAGCSPANEGAIRYNTTANDLEYCNATAWQLIKPQGLTIGGWVYSYGASAFNVSTVIANTLLPSNPTTSVITIPTSGSYLLEAEQYTCAPSYGGNDSYYAGSIIYINGTETFFSVSLPTDCASATTMGFDTLNKGDTVTGACFNQDGNQSNQAYCYLTIIKL